MKSQAKQVQIRQGDVFFIPRHIPSSAVTLKRENGLVVFAYGEVTGHHHSTGDGGTTLLEHEGKRYLRTDGCNVSHQEHSTLALPRGEYEVVPQVEYTSEGIEAVRD